MSPNSFRVDPAFEHGSHFADDWALCQLRLQDDARFSWLILIPRIEGAVEIEDLRPDDRVRLTEEIVRAGRLLRHLADQAGRPIDKLNVAALGNVTAQLHVHVVGRRRDDPYWPDPVWGRGGAVPYGARTREAVLAAISASG